ncbi:MAG TPA: hypothetical protein VE553_08585 [Candidatus Binatia bacterium]|jgi:hypothetical protein|nr:hypothetical protein [Candidatus Binatia bacterium]
MKEMFNQVVGRVHFSKAQLQVLIVVIILLLLVVGSAAPTTFGGWGGT